MSLLRFIKRDRSERPAPAVAVAPTPPPPPPVLPPPVAPRAESFSPPAAPAAVDLDRIRRELQAIHRIVGAEETIHGQIRAPQDAVDVDMKLGEVVRLCPQAFKDPVALQSASSTIIQVSVPALYSQLTKGRVVTKLHLLVLDIPADNLSPYAAEHADDDIALPLAMIVAAIQPEDLRRRTASQERDLGDRSLPNLFTPASVAAAAAAELAPAPAPLAEPLPAEPAPVAAAAEVAPVETVPPTPEVEPIAAMPVPESVVTEPSVTLQAEEPVTVPVTLPMAPTPEPVLPVAEESEPVPESDPVSQVAAEALPPLAPEPALVVESGRVPPVEPVAAEPAMAEAQTAAVEMEGVTELPAASEDESGPCRLMLGGIDLNRATAEELHARLDGVGLRLARNLVASREQAGPFSDLYDLARVPGLRAKRFEQVTGLPWNAAYFRHRDQVLTLVGGSATDIPDVRQVATRFTEVGDFAGCMLIDEDGLVLAQSWNHPAADALGAFAPQMFKKIHRYVKPLKMGEMNSVCFFVGHQPITVVRSGQIYFAALHQVDRLTKKQVTLVQALAMELGRRFARRAAA